MFFLTSHISLLASSLLHTLRDADFYDFLCKEMKEDYQRIVEQLRLNKEVFRVLLANNSPEAILWRPRAEAWCMLEVICHLLDEEREDFRVRVKHTLEKPTEAPPPIDPVGWVKARNYIEQDFTESCEAFLTERDRSIAWLESLTEDDWAKMKNPVPQAFRRAHTYFSNWLAHDYLHIRQLTKLKYEYLKIATEEDLKYAGNWVL